jgi:hypothetical protein
LAGTRKLPAAKPMEPRNSTIFAAQLAVNAMAPELPPGRARAPGPEHRRTQPPGHRAPVRTRSALARDRGHRFLLPRGRPGSLTSRSYWRAMAIRISLSVSVMRSPDRSTVTVRRVPVNGNGAW